MHEMGTDRAKPGCVGKSRGHSRRYTKHQSQQDQRDQHEAKRLMQLSHKAMYLFSPKQPDILYGEEGYDQGCDYPM
jgi:hypothetical protein